MQKGGLIGERGLIERRLKENIRYLQRSDLTDRVHVIQAAEFVRMVIVLCLYPATPVRSLMCNELQISEMRCIVCFQVSARPHWSVLPL